MVGAISDRDITAAEETTTTTTTTTDTTITTTQPADTPPSGGATNTTRLDANETDANANQGRPQCEAQPPSFDDEHSNINTDNNQNKTVTMVTAGDPDIMEYDDKVVLREKPGTDPVNVPGNKPGILHRISGSFGSITSGSFPSSPNFSSFVDFSSGLFAASREDPSHSPTTRSPTNKSATHSPTAKSVSPGRATPEGERPDVTKHHDVTKQHDVMHDIELDMESAIKLSDRPELFRSLNGK